MGVGRFGGSWSAPSWGLGHIRGGRGEDWCLGSATDASGVTGGCLGVCRMAGTGGTGARSGNEWARRAGLGRLPRWAGAEHRCRRRRGAGAGAGGWVSSGLVGSPS